MERSTAILARRGSRFRAESGDTAADSREDSAIGEEIGRITSARKATRPERESYEEGNDWATARRSGADAGVGSPARRPDRHDRRTGNYRLVRRQARSLLSAWGATETIPQIGFVRCPALGQSSQYSGSSIARARTFP